MSLFNVPVHIFPKAIENSIMKRQVVTGLLLVSVAGISFGQSRLSVGDRIEMAARVEAMVKSDRKYTRADAPVGLLIKYADDATLDRLREIGTEVTVYPGNVAGVRTPAGKVNDVMSAKGVVSGSLMHKMEMHNRYARNYSRMNYVRSGRDLPQGYDGTGIITGIYDTGLDIQNPNFRDSTGNRRISEVYSYPEGEGTPNIYSGKNLDAFTTDTEKESHGTHVLGTMSGSFISRAEGAEDLRGMAPGSEILIATGQGYDSQILDAAFQIGKYSSQSGKKAVMNISWGSNDGPHDGSDEFTFSLNAVADLFDMLICMSAGNERQQPIAMLKDLNEESSTATLVLEVGSDPEYTCNQAYGPLKIYGRDDTPFEVEIQIIDINNPDRPIYTRNLRENRETYVAAGDFIDEFISGYDSDVVLKEESLFNEVYKDSFIGGALGVDAANGRYCADMFACLTAIEGVDSPYRIKIIVKGTPGQKIFAYSGSSSWMKFNTRLGDRITGEGTNSSIACGPNTLSVGSYVSSSPAEAGYGNAKTRTISYFSSYGPTLDGRYVPELCAPGQVLNSTRNRYLKSGYRVTVTYKDDLSGDNVEYAYSAGTSMAAPVVTGTAAVLRQINPHLSYRDIKRIMIETCDDPKYVEEKGWGAGQMNSWKAAMEIAKNAGVKGNIVDELGILVNRESNGKWNIVVPAAADIRADLYDMSGMKVDSAMASGSSMIYDGSHLGNGVYILCIVSDNKTKRIKFAR